MTQAGLGQIAKERIGSVRLVQRVPVYPELYANRTGAEETLEYHRKRCLPPVHSSVEKANCRCGSSVAEISTCLRYAVCIHAYE